MCSTRGSNERASMSTAARSRAGPSGCIALALPRICDGRASRDETVVSATNASVADQPHCGSFRNSWSAERPCRVVRQPRELARNAFLSLRLHLLVIRHPERQRRVRRRPLRHRRRRRRRRRRPTVEANTFDHRLRINHSRAPTADQHDSPEHTVTYDRDCHVARGRVGKYDVRRRHGSPGWQPACAAAQAGSVAPLTVAPEAFDAHRLRFLLLEGIHRRVICQVDPTDRVHVGQLDDKARSSAPTSTCCHRTVHSPGARSRTCRRRCIPTSAARVARATVAAVARIPRCVHEAHGRRDLLCCKLTEPEGYSAAAQHLIHLRWSSSR